MIDEFDEFEELDVFESGGGLDEFELLPKGRVSTILQ
jgi:hypothetical protein